MAAIPQSQFARIERLPPYVFSITSELKMAALQLLLGFEAE